jgi:hypothetical protein
MDIRFCPSCGTARQHGGMFCASCGNRLGIDAVPTSPFTDDFSRTTSDAQWPSPVISSVSIEPLLKVLRILVALSPLPALLAFLDGWYWNEDIQLIWSISVLLPALIVAIPLLGERKLLGLVVSDDRFVLVSAVAALLVALRAADALIEGWYSDQGLVVLSQLIGMLGFAVVGVSFPWKKPFRSWFAEDLNPVHVSLAVVAALSFLAARNLAEWQFIFSPASLTGNSIFEWVFIALLVATGFMASPWRNCVAIPIGVFSILSFVANALLAEGTIRPWPNPVTFACCVALCFPWEEMANQENANF